ncbi:MAG TPA: STAS domain-containing protein [Trebonia sp.]|nr:STAS domain-containing protein [Trebonia sp.]
MTPFYAAVTAGESGPVIALSGEADLTVVPVLEEVLGTQISSGARLVTMDLSELAFADSATIGALLRASRVLRDLGGGLELRDPQPAVARTLQLLGVDQVLPVRGEASLPHPPPGT